MLLSINLEVLYFQKSHGKIDIIEKAKKKRNFVLSAFFISKIAIINDIIITIIPIVSVFIKLKIKIFKNKKTRSWLNKFFPGLDKFIEWINRDDV